MPGKLLNPMPLGRAGAPFSHRDWLFEIKWDGFRALAQVESGECRLVSRNGNTFKSFGALNQAISAELAGRTAVLDGEIVCLDGQGKSQFRNLLFRRGEARFYAFDVLAADGEDLRYLPLIERKFRLRALVSPRRERLLYCDHVEGDGDGLFRLTCEADLEGIVAKHKYGPYLPQQQTTWLKVRNQAYSQWAGREELFNRERDGDPDFPAWEGCARACAVAEG